MSAPRRPARRWVWVLLGALFLAALVWSTFSQAGVECEVCIDYGGGSICRSVAAADRQEAARQAQANACAILSQGVTQGLECDRTPPRSLRCSEP